MAQDPYLPPAILNKPQEFTYQVIATGVSSAVTYEWITVIKPPNGVVALESPAAATTKITVGGDGTYAFRVIVRDGANISWKDLWLTVSAGILQNQITPTTIPIVLEQIPAPLVVDTMKPVITSVTYTGSGNQPIPQNSIVNFSGSSVTLTVKPTDNLGVQSVDLYVNNVFIDRKATLFDSKFPASVSLSWSQNLIPTGTYDIKLRAYDGNGNASDLYVFKMRK